MAQTGIDTSTTKNDYNQEMNTVLILISTTSIIINPNQGIWCPTEQNNPLKKDSMDTTTETSHYRPVLTSAKSDIMIIILALCFNSCFKSVTNRSLTLIAIHTLPELQKNQIPPPNPMMIRKRKHPYKSTVRKKRKLRPQSLNPNIRGRVSKRKPEEGNLNS